MNGIGKSTFALPVHEEVALSSRCLPQLECRKRWILDCRIMTSGRSCEILTKLHVYCSVREAHEVYEYMLFQAESLGLRLERGRRLQEKDVRYTKLSEATNEPPMSTIIQDHTSSTGRNSQQQASFRNIPSS